VMNISIFDCIYIGCITKIAIRPGQIIVSVDDFELNFNINRKLRVATKIGSTFFWFLQVTGQL
jgi:hypothetical protein